MESTNDRPTDPGHRPSLMGEADVRAAEEVATTAHQGQVDKADRPYIDHPRRVVGHLVEPTPVQSVVAWLHDVVEDTITTLEDVDRAFGSEIASAVDAMTHRPGETSAHYYARVKANPTALVVKTADLADNTDPERLRVLAPEVRARLETKYAHARHELGLA